MLFLTPCSLPAQALGSVSYFPPTFSLSELHLKGPHCLKYVYLERKSLVCGDILAGANPPDGLQQWRASCMWLGWIPPASPDSMFLILEPIFYSTFLNVGFCLFCYSSSFLLGSFNISILQSRIGSLPYIVSWTLTHKLLDYKFTCEDHSLQTRYLIFLHKAREQIAPWVLVSLSGEARSSDI